MHHQVVVQSSQIGTAIEITSISWKYVSLDPAAVCPNFTMHLGYCAEDTLQLDFESNYIPGSKTQVFSKNPLQIMGISGQWTTLVLDEPFWYNGQDNLIIECQWDGLSDDNSFYTSHWFAGNSTALHETDTPTHVHELSALVPNMLISGELYLENNTAGGIKILVGQ